MKTGYFRNNVTGAVHGKLPSKGNLSSGGLEEEVKPGKKAEDQALEFDPGKVIAREEALASIHSRESIKKIIQKFFVQANTSKELMLKLVSYLSLGEKDEYKKIKLIFIKQRRDLEDEKDLRIFNVTAEIFKTVGSANLDFSFDPDRKLSSDNFSSVIDKITESLYKYFKK